MKKTLFTTAFILYSAALFICCTPKSPVEKLKALADEIELNYQSYPEEDWEKAALKYTKIENEFDKEVRTKEEHKEFCRQAGRIKGYMTKNSLKNFGEEIEEFANELGGGIEGFIESIGNMVRE